MSRVSLLDWNKPKTTALLVFGNIVSPKQANFLYPSQPSFPHRNKRILVRPSPMPFLLTAAASAMVVERHPFCETRLMPMTTYSTYSFNMKCLGPIPFILQKVLSGLPFAFSPPEKNERIIPVVKSIPFKTNWAKCNMFLSAHRSGYHGGWGEVGLFGLPRPLAPPPSPYNHYYRTSADPPKTASQETVQKTQSQTDAQDPNPKTPKTQIDAHPNSNPISAASVASWMRPQATLAPVKSCTTKARPKMSSGETKKKRPEKAAVKWMVAIFETRTFAGICRGDHQKPGFLRWCRNSSIHLRVRGTFKG